MTFDIRAFAGKPTCVTVGNLTFSDYWDIEDTKGSRLSR
jgi:hypothetical protein